MKTLRITALALVPVAIALAVVITQPGLRHSVTGGHPGSVAPAASGLAKPGGCTGLDTSKRYVGAVLYRPQQDSLGTFVKLAGFRPSIIEYYVDFGSSFDMDRAALIYRDSAFPVLQIDPYHPSLRVIAQGYYDTYLRAQARAVAKFGCPIAISFAHEMDGPWYSWGYTHSSPAVLIAAWRHIHHVFDAAGAKNVIWTWTISRVSKYTSKLKTWWPGSKYVDWIGVDGYYRNAQINFEQLFGTTLRDVRSLTSDPTLLTETAVTRRGPEPAQIKDLFQGARRSGLFGVIWFDVNALQQWTLAGRPPAALAALREAAQEYTH